MAEIIYLLHEEGSTLYKIGKTTQDSATERLKQYQAGNARRIYPVMEVDVFDCTESETAMKRQFKAYKTNLGGGSEWFDLKGDRLREVQIAFNQQGQARNPIPQETFWEGFWSVPLWIGRQIATGGRKLAKPPKRKQDRNNLIWLALIVVAVVGLAGHQRSRSTITPTYPTQSVR